MPIIDTKVWIRTFIEECQKNNRKRSATLQMEAIGGPLKSFFPHIPTKNLMNILLKQGLFEAEEWQDISMIEKREVQCDLWKIAQKELSLLVKRWDGPDCPVIILPISRKKRKTDEQPFEKNGLAFKEGMFLFLSSELSSGSLKAIFAHEYNHVCRLNRLNIPSEKMNLKESLIIEGLGEYAVKQMAGEQFLAPWTGLYTLKERMKIWKKVFVPELLSKGTDQHQKFLYGTSSKMLPRWIGYHIGFHIVSSYVQKKGATSMKQLLSISADEFISQSAFKLDD
ncbi:DUF2268 domain-containing putative Zn-dependent protease [Jeotgalibacillus sp. ET6]|uniref:DUF2268 domain-containing protein n=1 Tax=Jeotgalibacillus sp. ET6 TaxID=3037260 RepID=UPI0024189B6F|nr:DUF2268 domain-containing putative Zn-dependent protease [Jeotgalibacillus sp. ET6]MDG5473660.1 DUF2268 domain-containing putative Zn-dependent protease [Jeotgalibacillus sp. ET6]